MSTIDLRNNIEKVLGNSIRCLLPSYWWKRLFHQVADTIDTINGVEIVGSEAKLKNLDAQQGSLASVATRKEMKISECYFLTEEDESLTEAELFAKLTPVKAIKVNFPLPDLSSADAVLQLVSEDKKYLGHLMLSEGLCGAVFIDVAAGTQKYWILTSQFTVDAVNNFLKEKKFYILDDREDIGEENMALFDSVFTIVDSNTDVYVKGLAWERLAKEGESEGGSTPSTPSTKYTLYIPNNNEELADVYKQKNKEVVSVALKGDIQPSQITLVFQNGDGSDALEGLYKVNQLTASLENNQGILVLYAIASLQVFNDGVKGGELKLVFKNDGSARWSEVVAKPRPIVYIPLPDSTKQVTSSQKADNLKMFDILNAVLKNNRDELPDLILSVQNSSYDSTRISIAPSLYYRASGTNADGQQVEAILFIGTFTDSKIISAALYSDGTAKANLTGLSAEVISDTALSTTSENPLQNKVVTAELAKKQDNLVSGTSIKTINGTPLLGSGDIKVAADVTIDSFLSPSSTNPVQNKVVYNALQYKANTSSLNSKADKSDIKTINGVSLLGGGNLQLGDGQTIVYDDSQVQTRLTSLETTSDDIYDEIDAIWDEVDGILDDMSLDYKDFSNALDDLTDETNELIARVDDMEADNKMMDSFLSQGFYTMPLRKIFAIPLYPGFVITDFTANSLALIIEEGGTQYVYKEDLPYVVQKKIIGNDAAFNDETISFQSANYAKLLALESRLSALESQNA